MGSSAPAEMLSSCLTAEVGLGRSAWSPLTASPGTLSRLPQSSSSLLPIVLIPLILSHLLNIHHIIEFVHFPHAHFMGGNLQVSQGNNINYFILITILYMR